MPPPLSLSISRTQQSRLPYPLGLYWLRAQQARTPLDVYLATEGILRTLTALVLCEAIHAPMTAEQETLLRGGPERRAFERPSFGRRIELLRTAVALHAGVERPILEGVQAWWEQFDGARGVLQRLAEARNEHAHGAAPMGEAASDESRRTALTRVAELIRAANFATANGPSAFCKHSTAAACRGALRPRASNSSAPTSRASTANFRLRGACPVSRTARGKMQRNASCSSHP